jgi:3-methyladenine DNA glycosylase/8-oxoguanine DNA glycosylase
VLPDAEARFTINRPLDLGLTLAPLDRGPSLRSEDGAVVRATRTPEGPTTLRIQHTDGELFAQAWGPGAEWAASRADFLCGQSDDDSGFRAAHPLIAQLHRRAVGMRIPRTGAVFEALVPAVLGQLVTTVEAHRSYRALVMALAEPAPGPWRLVLPPSPHVLARMPYWAFHRFGIERRRAEVVIRAARSLRRLEETVTMDLPSAYRRLQAFGGVGPWTAAKVALVALGDADAVPVGDYNLPHAIGYALEGTARSTDERMLELLEPYRGHRARVVRMITMAGIGAPRFGPRRPLRDISRN